MSATQGFPVPRCCICELSILGTAHPATDPASGRPAKVCDGCVDFYREGEALSADAAISANHEYFNRP